MSDDDACTIITVDGKEVARCPSVDTGRPHNHQPRLAIIHESVVPWTEVIAQRHLDTDARRSVHEKFIEWTGQRMVVLGRYDPGMIIERHGHRSDHLIYVLEGEMACGDYPCPRGTLIVLEEGAVFGPLIADATDGCLLFETWLDDPTPVSVDKPGYNQLLADNRHERLPNPPFTPPPHAQGKFGTGDRFS